MKHSQLIVLIAALATFMAPGMQAQTMPDFSSGSEEHWYYIIFSSGEAALEDEGAGKNVVTHQVSRGKESQLWKLTGNADSFTMENKLGNVIKVTDYVNTSSTAGEASALRLHKSSNAAFDTSWEIEYLGKEDEWDRFNQWGGSGNGHRIGCYTPGDPNNALTFLAEADLKETPQLTRIKEFKVNGMTSFVPERRHTLWYDMPATSNDGNIWMEYALPVGNGYFGAMTFGGIAQDRLQFNDKSLWTGSSRLRGCYQNFGDLYIEDISGVFGNTDENAVRNYVRYLDLSQGISRVEYSSPDASVRYTREYLASYPDKVVAMRLAASEKGKINIRLRLFNGIRMGIVVPEYSDGRISFEGKLDLVSFKAAVRPIVTGGKIVTKDDCLEITDADEVVVLLAGATNFDQHSPTYTSDAEAMRSIVDTRISDAEAKGWEHILADHIADFSPYFDRVEFSLDKSAYDRPTDQLVRNYNTLDFLRVPEAALMLEELYYAYGRYLLISCSRGMDSPANLQGIWNNSSSPAWQCDIHSNINVQMNYWPAESTNLSEMHIPYLNYIHSMATEHPQWQEYAHRSGQEKGWTCFTQNNIFGHSDYAENYVIANAWYCTHLWQHYVYTIDRDFLRDKAMPAMKGCAEFWMERLKKDTDGKWVAPDEWSPEHGPAAEDGTAHAQQILDAFFSQVLAAADVLGEDAGLTDEFLAELRDKHANLDKGLATETYTGAWGSPLYDIKEGDTLLREWKTSDYSAGQNEHRHQSHLMGLYPFSSITPETEWFEPAVNSLRLRGDVSTGWSLAWRIALWARALDPQHAHKIIRSALRHSTSTSQSQDSGGVYYNLFDSHAPFQIDGNFGYTAAVTEMLLQSYGGTLRLLPSLPEVWSDGHVRGIKGEGNFEVDCTWKNGILTEGVIKSGAGLKCRLLYPDAAKSSVSSSDGSKVEFKVIDGNSIEFDTRVGESYTIMTEYGLGVASADVSDADIHFSRRTATATRPDMKLDAYDVAGSRIASGRGSVSLDVPAGTLVIVKGTAEGTTVARKFLVETY